MEKTDDRFKLLEQRASDLEKRLQKLESASAAADERKPPRPNGPPQGP